MSTVRTRSSTPRMRTLSSRISSAPARRSPAPRSRVWSRHGLAGSDPNASTGATLARVSPPKRHARAILGNLERRGRFVVEDGMKATAIFGNVELDLRDVVLAPGRTHLEVRAVFGNVELVVPPELSVECEGSGILGSFSSIHRIPPEGSDERAVLVIHGSAVFGNVEIRTLPRGGHRR